ncbi:hypothetical protein GA0070560_1554 [Micromonospora halophytica]|uniref:Uncharacterized protein n=2 Tax=Micromonospora halophytica TaxID=47864 RepID=A0A1C5JPH9_9ACTN|nr:hypothetical protein GA0070560_1554 [Micromonospora halophytica]
MPGGFFDGCGVAVLDDVIGARPADTTLAGRLVEREMLVSLPIPQRSATRITCCRSRLVTPTVSTSPGGCRATLASVFHFGGRS